jgi:hypothetical protein
VSVGSKKHFLRNILGFGLIIEQAHRQGENGVLMRLHERLKS